MTTPTKIRTTIDSDDYDHEINSVDTTVTTEADVMDMSENNYCNISGEELVWYFSYGSNMNPAVFEEKRKIKSRDFKICKVPGYVLTYTHGLVPFVEPAYCTCVERNKIQDDRPDIHGVAFLITRAQYEHMLLTEGGWGYQEYRKDFWWSIGHYGEEEVECHEILPEGSNDENTSPQTLCKPFKALTLVGLLGVRQKYDANSSKRYHDLVNVGAEASGLPKSYREYLKEKHPPFEPTNCWRANLAMWIYFVALIPIIVLEIGTMKACASRNERKLEERESQQQLLQDDEPSTSRRNFQNVTRPPWIIMRFCFFYRTVVMEIIMFTLLFDVCKLPNGFRNKYCALAKATSTSDKKSL